ncbi:MAG: alpha/beta hydrolase fold domain-containing protein [Kiloniellales bacterium]|nr:alpha/beta hydrolase fold domain-containing protein [Kiloniellales bacterium]
MARIDLAARLDPQMAAALGKSQDLAPGLTAIPDLPIPELRRLYAEERRFWNADRPEVARVFEDKLPGPAGDIPIRIYHPSERTDLPALIFLHGGGWIMGSLDTHDKIMRVLALESGFAVVGVDYSLAPEHRFPTALDETLAVVGACATLGGDWGLDPARLAVGGDSAGANLSLAALFECRDRGPTLSAGLLYYGAYGLQDSASRRLYGGPEDGLSTRDLDYYRDCLVRSPADRADPRIDLLTRDPAGLPPLFIGAAALDPLLDDSRALAELAAAAGVPHDLTVYPGVLHGFLHLSRMVDLARSALEDGARWLSSQLAP